MSDQDSPSHYLGIGHNQIEIANRTYSEIRMEQIVNDNEFEYASIVDDEFQSRTKVIPTMANETIICRNTIELQTTQPTLLQRCFGSKRVKNRVTMRQMIDLRQKELFNDYAYETEQKGLLQDFSKYIDKVKIIEPDSIYYIIWQVLNSVVVILFFFQIPFMLAYQPLIDDKQANRYKTFEEYSLDVGISIFIIDIFISLNTAYFKQGQLVLNRKHIIFHYLKTDFLLDLIPLLCLIEYRILLSHEFTFGLELLLFILKIYEVSKTSNMIQEYFQLEPARLAAYRLLTVMLTIIWLCHVFSCVFFTVGRHKVENKYPSWLTHSDIVVENVKLYDASENANYEKLNIVDLHLFSFYWAVTTMISVGYGDVTPMNDWEVSVTVITQFISCIVFAYSVNAIWEMINQQNENKSKFQKYVNAIERFMREHNVDRKLKARIEAYLFHLWQSEKARDHELEQAMILKLAPALKEELIFQTFGKMFNNNQFFSNFSQDFLIELSSDIQQLYYSQEENIFQENEEIDDFPIYYLVKGSVEIYLDSEKRIKLHFIKSGIFGIVGFITGTKRTASARCVTYSVIYKLSRNAFLQKLEKFPVDKQHFFEIRHQVLFNNDFQNTQLKCYICESKRHLATNCNRTLYIPQKQAIILQYYNVKNQRVEAFQRKVVKQQFKALSHVKEVQFNAFAIRKYFQNITFSNDSSNEDNEYSSDVDDYEEEMEEIKKIVEEEKEKQKQKQKTKQVKRGEWLADDDYEMKIQDKEQKESNSVEFSGDQLHQSQKIVKNSEGEQKKKSKKKKKFESFVKLQRNVRTYSMSSLTPIQEQVKKPSQPQIKREKGVSALLPNNFVALRKKSKLVVNEIPNVEKSPLLLQSNDRIEKIPSPDRLLTEQKKSELIRKLKFLQIAQPRNKDIQNIIEELKTIINQPNLQAKENNSAIKKASEEQEQQSNQSDVDSQFSIDHMASYEYFFQDENPEKVIKKLKKITKERIRQRRTTLMRQFDD